MVLTRDGLVVYANKSGLRSIAQFLEWMSDSPSEDNYELHTKLYISGADSNGYSPEGAAAFVLKDDDIVDFDVLPRDVLVHGEKLRTAGFELTFMQVTEEQLDSLQQYEATGKRPKPD